MTETRPEAAPSGKTKVSVDFGKRGWSLVIYCFWTFFFGCSLSCTLNVYVSILHELHGWSTVLLYSSSSIVAYVSMGLYYILGILRAKGKIGLRKGILISGILASVSVCFWGYVGSAWMFVLIYCITMCSSNVWGQFFNNNMVANWYPRKKGLVMGWTTIGFPVGSCFGVLIWDWLEGVTGSVARGYMCYGVVFIILTIWGYTMFRDYPEEIGEFPDNDKNMTREKAQELLEEGKRLSANSPWTVKRCLSCWEVWVIGFANSTIIFFAGGTIGQMVPNLLEAGYDQQTAIYMMTFACLFAGVASVLLGMLDAKVGTKKAIIITQMIAVVAAIFRNIPSFVTILLSLACVGTLLGGGPNFVVSSVSTYWGRYNFDKVYGIVLVINQLFGGYGATAMAVLANKYGYATGYLMLAGYVAIGAIALSRVKDGFVQKYEEKWALEDAQKASSEKA
jgi:OFA family oxalate/formate antiporter-like MFS transporter